MPAPPRSRGRRRAPRASRGLALAVEPQGDRARGVVGGRRERHVDDVDARLAERERDLARRRPAGSGTETRSSPTALTASSAPRSRRRSSRAPSFQAATASPSPAARAARTRARRATVSSIAAHERVGVGEVDVAPHRRVGAGHAGHVAEARPGGGQPLALLRQRARGLRDEHVGQHVRQVGDDGEHAVVGLGVERGGAGAERGEQAVQALVQRAAGARRRRQVPGGAVERAPRARGGRPRSRRRRAGGRR